VGELRSKNGDEEFPENEQHLQVQSLIQPETTKYGDVPLI
jgi:hypothetical protein